MSNSEALNGDDPLSLMPTDEIYKLKISDSRIDLAAKLFRECEAMISYICSRGINVDEKLFDKVSMFSIGIKQRHTIPLSALMQLHSELADAIDPALPDATEMLLWESRKYHRLSFWAPVTSMRYLMLFAFLSMLVFCGTLVFGQLTTGEISRSILAHSELEIAATPTGTEAGDAGDTAAPTGDAGDSGTPTADAGTAGKPTAEPGDTAAPTAEPGDTAAPAADAGVTAAPTADAGDTAAPTADAGDTAASTADAGTTAAPTGDAGTTGTPTADAGTTGTPVADAGTAATPVADAGDTGTPTAKSESVGSVTGAGSTVVKTVDWRKRLMLTIYFLSISGIGASFAALYDARKYVIAGQFDPRSANYAIRILLGLIAGLLLSQVISEPYSATLLSSAGGDANEGANRLLEKDNMLKSLSKSILALLGGFASQFVYKALKRLVDALESIFDPDAALQAAVKNYRKQLADQAAQAAETKRRNAELTQLGGQLANARTEEERTQLQQSMVNVLVGEDGEAAGSGASQIERKKAERKLGELEANLDVKADLALLLPKDEAEEVNLKIAEWRERLRGFRQKGDKLANAENIAAVASLASIILAFNPVAMVVGAGTGVISGLLGATAANRVPSLLRIMIAASRTLDIEDYQKWKDILLGERNANPAMAITGAILKRARAVLKRVPIIGSILSLFDSRPDLDDDAVIQKLIKDVLDSDRATAIARIKDAVATREKDASELVDLLSSYLASEAELGETVKTRLSNEVRETVDTPVDELIDMARRTISNGIEGRSVIERLLSIADAVADDAISLTTKDVEDALRAARSGTA